MKTIFEISNQVLLTNPPPALVQELYAAFSVENPAYADAERLGRATCNLDQWLRFCEVVSNILVLPRGAARFIHDRACQYGEVGIVDERLALSEIDLSFDGQLRPYQQQAVAGVLSKDFGVLEAGTGSGKTIMALSITAARKQPTLILVHTKELLHQWQDRIRQFLNIEAGLVGDGKFNVQPVTVGIVNSVRANLEKLVPLFGHVIVDECHRVPSTMFTETVKAFPAKYLLGLSATPYRRDGLDKLIGWFIGNHKTTVDRATLREVGAVLRPKIVTRETRFDYWFNDDYSRMLSAIAGDQDRNRLIAADVREQSAKGGLSLVVSDRTEHLKALAAMVKVDGSAVLTGKTPAKERKRIVADLQEGKIKTLFSTLSLIGEGFDCPAMDALFLASPIKFSGRLTQTVGRVLRPSEGKVPVVFDYVDSRVGLLAYQAKARRKVYATM